MDVLPSLIPFLFRSISVSQSAVYVHISFFLMSEAIRFAFQTPLQLNRQVVLENARAGVAVCAITNDSQEYDVIVIGAGLGGLSTGALLAAHGRRVAVLEAHTEIGGAAHAFRRRTSDGEFRFESGPHLFSGLSQNSSSNNPLRDVLRATNSDVRVASYDKWGVFIGESFEPTSVTRSQPFLQKLMKKHGGISAPDDVARLLKEMEALGDLAASLPPALIRARDILGSLRVAARRALRPSVLRHLPRAGALAKPFGPLLRKHVTDEFAIDFLNLLCFLLAGVQADEIPIAEVAFMFREWTGNDLVNTNEDAGIHNAVLQHPIGGASAIADALASSIRRNPHCIVRTNARVDHITLDASNVVTGVQLSIDQTYISAETVVASTAALNTPGLLPDNLVKLGSSSSSTHMPGCDGDLGVSSSQCDSFMHLHVAVQLTPSLRETIAGGELLPNYVSVEDFNRGVNARDNVVLISVPSVIDDTVCPRGFAVVHAYCPATEPYAPWHSLRRGTSEYEEYKVERSAVLWRAVSSVFGQDIEPLATIKLVGSPKTHAHYLNRRFGSYGPKVNASLPGLGIPFPGSQPLPEGLIGVGDGVFPGIGVPAVAGSAWIVANGLVSIAEQEAMLRRIGI